MAYKEVTLNSISDYRLIDYSSQSREVKVLEERFLAICDRESMIDSRCRSISKNSLKIFALLLSVGAKVPFIPISLDFGNIMIGGVAGKIVGPIFAGGNVTSFCILEYWAAKNIVNDLFPQQIDIDSRNASCHILGVYRKVTIISTATLMALVSQAPTALAGIKYNAQDYKYPAGLTLLVTGSLLPLRSLQLTLERLNCNFNQVITPQKKLQQEMVDLCLSHRQLFVEMGWEAKLALIEDLNAIRNSGDEAGKADQYAWTLLALPTTTPKPQNTLFRKVVNYTSTATGVLITGIFQYALADYTFYQSKEYVWDNDVAAGCFASLTVGCCAYLFGQSFIGTSQRIFNSASNLITQQNVPTINEQLRPKLTFLLKSIGLLINALALGPTIVIWGQFFDQYTAEKIFFDVSICSAIFLLLFTSTIDIANEIAETLIIVKGSEEEKEIMQVYDEYQKLATLFNKHNAEPFLTGLQEHTRNRIISKFQDSQAYVNSIIESRE